MPLGKRQGRSVFRSIRLLNILSHIGPAAYSSHSATAAPIAWVVEIGTLAHLAIPMASVAAVFAAHELNSM